MIINERGIVQSVALGDDNRKYAVDVRVYGLRSLTTINVTREQGAQINFGDVVDVQFTISKPEVVV